MLEHPSPILARVCSQSVRETGCEHSSYWCENGYYCRTSKLSRSSSTRPQASLRLEVCSRRTVCSRPPCVYAAARMPIRFRHELPGLAQVQVARGSAGAKSSRQNQEPHKRSRRNGRERTRGASIALLCLIDRWSRERAWNSLVLSHICRYR